MAGRREVVESKAGEERVEVVMGRDPIVGWGFNGCPCSLCCLFLMVLPSRMNTRQRFDEDFSLGLAFWRMSAEKRGCWPPSKERRHVIPVRNSDRTTSRHSMKVP
jgi:hypothetical protein